MLSAAAATRPQLSRSVDNKTGHANPQMEGARQSLADALVRVAAGDRDAFEEVFQRTSSRLNGVCLQIVGDRTESEDVLQEVYCSIWRSAGLFDVRRGTAMTWLMTIARNRAIDHLRRPGRADSLPVEAAHRVADPQASAFDSIAYDQEHGEVRLSLERLNARDSAALKKAFFAGLTYVDLAAEANVPVATMKSRMRRALLRLRASMS